MILRLLSGNISLELFLFFLVAIVIAISIHEFSHAWAANRLGDPTARLEGRLTLNPAVHMDPVGTLLILFVGFGWGRPVPVNPAQLEGGRRGMAWVSLAGPVSNFVLATALGLMVRFGIVPPDLLISDMVGILIYLNFALGIFNLLPFGPLDGYKIAMGFLPPRYAYQLAKINQPQNLIITIFIAIFLFRYIFDFFFSLFFWLVVGG